MRSISKNNLRATSIGKNQGDVSAAYTLVHRELSYRPTSNLDPLTLADRHAISASIRNEVTDAALRIIRDEQETKEKLNAVHIKCISLMVIALVALGISMVYLRVVLVPFILAIFFMFLLEPLLFAFLGLPLIFQRTCIGRRFLKSLESKPRRPAEDCRDTCGGLGGVFLVGFGRKVWNFISVALCLTFLLTSCSMVVYFIVDAVNNMPWRKYQSSPRVQLIMDVFPALGSDPEELDFEKVWPLLLQGPLINVFGLVFTFVSQTFLMLLFLAFLLANDVRSSANDGVLGIGEMVRTSVRRYIRIKAGLAILVSLAVGILLWYVGVDGYFVFASLTLLLYYIPHVGNTVAVIAPLPLVFLDPLMSWGNLFTVFFVPFIIHQLATNLVEPKLLATSLELHPIVVLLALAFWTTVWGAMGAVLSVPLTAVLRLVLIEMDHPYARPIVWLLQGQISDVPVEPRSPRSKRSPLREDKTASSPHGSDVSDRTVVSYMVPERFINGANDAAEPYSATAKPPLTAGVPLGHETADLDTSMVVLETRSGDAMLDKSENILCI